MQIRKVNEEGLDVFRGSRLRSSARNRASLTELRRRKKLLAAYRRSEILSIILFADDIDLSLSHKNTDTLKKTMYQELRDIASWTSANKLQILGNTFYDFLIKKGKTKS